MMVIERRHLVASGPGTGVGNHDEAGVGQVPERIEHRCSCHVHGAIGKTFGNLIDRSMPSEILEGFDYGNPPGSNPKP